MAGVVAWTILLSFIAYLYFGVGPDVLFAWETWTRWQTWAIAVAIVVFGPLILAPVLKIFHDIDRATTHSLTEIYRHLKQQRAGGTPEVEAFRKDAALLDTIAEERERHEERKAQLIRKWGGEEKLTDQQRTFLAKMDANFEQLVKDSGFE